MARSEVGGGAREGGGGGGGVDRAGEGRGGGDAAGDAGEERGGRDLGIVRVAAGTAFVAFAFKLGWAARSMRPVVRHLVEEVFHRPPIRRCWTGVVVMVGLSIEARTRRMTGLVKPRHLDMGRDIGAEL